MWVKPVVLEGERLRLEPLSVEHAASLWQEQEPAIFRYMALLWEAQSSEEQFAKHVSDVAANPAFVTFTFIEKASGRAVGTSSYLDIRPEHRALEIGATWIAQPFQAGFVNPEAKLLMLSHAFDELGCVRVQLKSDARNMQSRGAMTKLGAQFEGILRKHIICPDGYIRDTAMFSIVAEEWPGVRQGLLDRLKANPNQVSAV